MTIRSAFTALALAYAPALAAQQPAVSIHQEQLEYHRQLGISPEGWQALNELEVAGKEPIMRSPLTDTCQLQKRVFGWHPYWSNGLENQYDWNLLSDLTYFAYEVNANTGMALNTYSWASAAVVDAALAHGTKVHLCATLFSNHATFFASPAAQQTLITNLITLVQQRGAHGVNIDFEAVPAAQSANLTAFIMALGTQLHAAMPEAELSVALPAVDWSAVFNVAAMTPYVDLFIIMGYDYYWSGSNQAGPTDPLYSFTAGYDRNHSRSIAYYLNAGVPREKMLLGVPYYGREWETVSDQAPAATTGAFHSSRTYKAVRDNSAIYINPRYHEPSMSNYFVYSSGGAWRQCFINSPHTLGRRYQMAQQRGLAGIGIWALGYDAGYDDLWNLLRDHFSSCAIQPLCADTLYDSGGPAWNYYHNENITFTLAPADAGALVVSFTSFQLESGYDTLWIYDGAGVEAPLIGAYTGSNSPGEVAASNGRELTFRFISDQNTSASGWQAVYSCQPMTDVSDVAPAQGAPLLYPNPAIAGVFNLRYQLAEQQQVRIDVFDAQGRQLYGQAQTMPSGEHETHIALPAHDQQVGLLWVRLQTATGSWTQRVALLK